MLYGRGMDGSCKAYGESLLHSKKQVEHERLRLAKTVGRLTNSYKGTYKRRQTHRFCSCIDGPLKAPPLTLFHYMRTRPVVNNCIPTPFLAFQPWPVERLVSCPAAPPTYGKVRLVTIDAFLGPSFSPKMGLANQSREK